MDIELKDLKEKLVPQNAREIQPEVVPQQEAKKDIHIPTASKIRTVRFNGYRSHINPEVTNKLNNRKYTVLNFVPSVLYNQFKYFFNMFFLLLCISQFIPIFKVGLLFSYVAPLVFVLVMTMIKEAFDDYKKFQRDKETNETLYNVWSGGGFKEIRSESIVEGHILELKVNDRIPADCVLLWSGDPSGTVFIKTDQLDGETDWKLRNPINYTQTSLSNTHDPSRLSGYIQYEEPNQEIYKFQGNFVNEVNRGQDQPLGAENTLWNSCVLCSTRALAIVIYIGRETRIAQNITERREKVGQLDQELNQLSKFLFIIMCVISFILNFNTQDSENMFVGTIKYVLLLSTIIPISLRVNLDFSKIVFTRNINVDEEIEAVARNSLIPEELGRVQVIFSDKTGTITTNEMKFKAFNSEHFRILEGDKRVEVLLKKELQKKEDPTQSTNSLLLKGGVGKGKAIKELIIALNACHNVTPVQEEGSRILQASSPDEIALVEAAEFYGLQLVDRDQ